MRLTSSNGVRVALVRFALACAALCVPAAVLTASTPAPWSHSSTVATTGAAAMFSPAVWADVELGDIDPRIFALALEAAASAVAHGQATDPSTLTVIDYSKPSTEKRMWVYDLRTHALLFDELVSHGRGSGRTSATSFSNDRSSNKTSLGLFRTGETYVGHNGYSLRLDGLERGVNDHARDRAIVIHGAPYVNAVVAKTNGYLGRSLGCPAVRPEIAHALIDSVKGGGLLFAYYPDPRWLKSSAY
jgi:hypothetical protein